MSSPWPSPPLDPRLPPPYLVGFELASGRIIRATAADSLVWAQVQLIQFVAAIRAIGGAGVVVLVRSADGQVRERVVVRPDGLPAR
jgi:hypothetical protein